jgi:hypothetical protein
MVIFQKFKFIFLMIIHTLLGSFLFAFTLLSVGKKIQDFVFGEKKSSKTHKKCWSKCCGLKIFTTNISDTNVHKMYIKCMNVTYYNVKKFKM